MDTVRLFLKYCSMPPVMDYLPGCYLMKCILIIIIIYKMNNFISFSFLVWSSFFLTPGLVLGFFCLFFLHFNSIHFYSVANVFRIFYIPVSIWTVYGKELLVNRKRALFSLCKCESHCFTIIYPKAFHRWYFLRWHYFLLLID